MKSFKSYIKESTGSVSHLLWDYGHVTGSAVLMVPADAFDKDEDKATLQTLKQKVPQARALTKLSREKNPITHTSAKGTEKHYLVRVDFTTKKLSEETEGPPTEVEKARDKQDREKKDLQEKHEREQETARERDFRNKETKRKQDIAKKEADKRTKERLSEYLEDGTDELADTYKKDTPGQ